ncbi:putative threonine dehydratase catabolic [Pectobacterium atrosepticum SCRI1043]|uniref:Threonine dehydratase catabolic n=1 Tax=Pectobacterium atrosepticum (strain SCRI 1043 / ATCC BAA-672) TaxID=218491 RepID=Q6D6V9_PECAS|nr:threonine/serine dehydratase [Pectobacterium atrosepticum]GKV84780.1 threonine dehydratase [Pectobacterium carotovorum subsp. carotovorum]AIA70516.1 threonine dehydratase [Pectobacterium atrosepticum]AIK13436.1 putative threonine dehydratase catabolic [Pectobacterium atrosepticum]ATY90333.1 threonine/serine dehydratase [Pectobacterium atrosepticum]KMK79553.1 putative threonine dehydratase catabolic [Pectobacterium atrosepticum ICMP 1526]
MTSKYQRATDSVTLKDIYTASQQIKTTIRRTPLDRSQELSALVGAEIRLKMENLQQTGSFKLRGAANVLANLGAEQRRIGVIAPTAGNHGLGLAYAGQVAGVPVTIFLPRSADPMKVAAMKGCGAHITFFDDIEEARQAAIAAAQQSSATFVSAYDNPHMIAGGGTVGLEIMEDWMDAEIILVNIGGGGLISGIATAVKAINPAIEVWGIQSEVSPTFARWKDAGETLPVELTPSIAEGVSGYIEPSAMTWPLVRDRVDRVLTVSEVEIKAAMLSMLELHRHVVEPSGVPAVAGAIRYAKEIGGRKTVCVVTGRNISSSRYLTLLNEATAGVDK